MRNGMMKRAAALLLAATMTVPAYAVYAEDNTQIEAEAAEAEAKAEAERQAAEAAAQAEAEKQAEEAAAQTEAATEAQTEAQTEAAETEAQTEATEVEEYQTSFKFENDEVVIVVKTSEEAKLGKDTKLTAKKLEEGSEKYEAAKAATVNSLGSDEEGTYSFYEIRFEKDGAELNVKDEHMDIDVTFKDASSAVQVKDGQAKRI